MKPKTIQQAIKLAKPDRDEQELINYKGRNKAKLRAKYLTMLILGIRVINDGWEANYNDYNQQKWFPRFYKEKTGFVFLGTYFYYWDTLDFGVPALALSSEENARHAGTVFASTYNKFLSM